ncbi:CARNS1 [Symbiodinium sp. CCMP2456]|nr:CARNS1 [Symbiodinium sp. CCMP2456]
MAFLQGLLKAFCPESCIGCFPFVFQRPCLPAISEQLPLHDSLTSEGFDPEDVTEVLCSPSLKEADLKVRVDQLPAKLKQELMCRLEAFDTLEAEPNPEALAVFAYGTLRGDFGPDGDKWGVLAKSEATWQPARVRGFRLYQDPRLTYPFAVRTGKDDDVIVGTVIQWPSAAAAKEQIANCNQIEGFRASQPEASKSGAGSGLGFRLRVLFASCSGFLKL